MHCNLTGHSACTLLMCQRWCSLTEALYRFVSRRFQMFFLFFFSPWWNRRIEVVKCHKRALEVGFCPTNYSSVLWEKASVLFLIIFMAFLGETFSSWRWDWHCDPWFAAVIMSSCRISLASTSIWQVNWEHPLYHLLSTTFNVNQSIHLSSRCWFRSRSVLFIN